MLFRLGSCSHWHPPNTWTTSVAEVRKKELRDFTNATEAIPSSGPTAAPTAGLARCFRRLANLLKYALDRLNPSAQVRLDETGS
jgi:hypothetical protein